MVENPDFLFWKKHEESSKHPMKDGVDDFEVVC